MSKQTTANYLLLLLAGVELCVLGTYSGLGGQEKTVDIVQQQTADTVLQSKHHSKVAVPAKERPGKAAVGTQVVPSAEPSPIPLPIVGVDQGESGCAGLWTLTRMILSLAAERDRHLKMSSCLLRGELTVRVEGDREFQFIYVPPGRFFLGYSDDDRIRLVEETGNVLFGNNAKPQVSIMVTEGYFVLNREITEAQFQSFRRATSKDGDTAKTDKTGQDDLPVRDVTWEEAVAFCDWLSKLSGYCVRLPTEIEWEYAARGPWPQRYPWPNTSEFHAWAEQDETRGPRSFDIVRKDVSWRGVYDLGGNVSEWCLDLFQERSYEDLRGEQSYSPAAARVQQSPSGRLGIRTCRGGSFKDRKVNCEVSIRRSLLQAERKPVLGFRPVLLVSQEMQAKRTEP